MTRLPKRAGKLEEGQFVHSSSNELGVGKLAEVSIDRAVIEYFKSPASDDRHRQEVDRDTIKLVTLEPQTRVYFKDPRSLIWQVGRVLHHQETDGKYLIRFPNKESRLIAEEELETRWNHAIEDPTDHLALQLNETPFWHDGRRQFIQSVFAQRRISGGIPALLSSSIDLVEHQIGVVRRVLLDPFQRYLLADEVGLGKTIEAGLLIRQYVLDVPKSHSVLVIVPESLIQQWVGELRHRFHLDDELGVSVHVVGHRQFDVISQLGQSVGMIVIDEAHHVAAWARSSDHDSAHAFDLICRITAPQERRVLLLSATPVLHNEWAFLAMLHIIDPLVYSLDEFEEFRERVRNRQEIADCLMSLTDDESNYFLRQTLDEMVDLFPDDERFHSLSRQLVVLLDHDIAEDSDERSALIRSLRLHVSETWRLHRRLLRNRRSESTQFLVPGRGGLQSCRWTSPDVATLEGLLNEWRLTASNWLYAQLDSTEADQLRVLATVLADVAACDPEALASVVAERIDGGCPEFDCLGLFDAEVQAVRQAPLLQGEREMLRQIANVSNSLSQTPRLEALHALIEGIYSESGTTPAIVVFASFQQTADRIYQFLARRLGPQEVVRHETENIRWTRFIGAASGLVLVCDRSAEEGLNLQNRRSVVIHYDLPLAPNRVEQRMGRLDRFGTGSPIQSYAILCEDSEQQTCWCECLADAFRVFDRSIASLQYAIDEEFARIRAEFPDAGVDAIRDGTTRLSDSDGVIEQEFRRIRAQDELDASGADDEFETEYVETLLRFDLRTSEFRGALDDWLVTRLHFRGSGEEGRNDGVVRYQFCRRDGLRGFGKDTLMPMSEFLSLFEASVDDVDNHRLPVVRETVPISFDRQVAQRRLTRLARIGDPLIDALDRFTHLDDRGICFAMWRYRPAVRVEGTAEIAFCFHLTTEADMEPLRQLAAEWRDVSLAAVRRRADMAFPPLSLILWLDSDLQRIVDPERLKLLQERYRGEPLRRQPESGRDYNLNHERWKAASEVCDIAVWRGLCYAAREKAEEILREQSQLPALTRQLADRATAVAESRLQQFESRSGRSSGRSDVTINRDATFERAFATSLQQAILSPAIQVDSMGAVFLSAHNPFTAERPVEDDD